MIWLARFEKQWWNDFVLLWAAIGEVSNPDLKVLAPEDDDAYYWEHANCSSCGNAPEEGYE